MPEVPTAPPYGRLRVAWSEQARVDLEMVVEDSDIREHLKNGAEETLHEAEEHGAGEQASKERAADEGRFGAIMWQRGGIQLSRPKWESADTGDGPWNYVLFYRRADGWAEFEVIAVRSCSQTADWWDRPKERAVSVELNAYLFFPGNTAQAMAFYQQVFGGEVSITRRGDIDPTAAPEQQNLVVFALLTGGDVTLRASDREDASPGSQNRVELSLVGTDDARLRALFDDLAKDGTVEVKLERQLWGGTSGTVIDKYGIGWQVNIDVAPM
jgi:PhnB protein